MKPSQRFGRNIYLRTLNFTILSVSVLCSHATRITRQRQRQGFLTVQNRSLSSRPSFAPTSPCALSYLSAKPGKGKQIRVLSRSISTNNNSDNKANNSLEKKQMTTKEYEHENEDTDEPKILTASVVASNRPLHQGADRILNFAQNTVWDEFTPLANSTGAINLGQGFPDWESPTFAKEAAIQGVQENFNQYCRSGGLPDLVQVLADHYSPLYDRELNPLTEITISVGVTEGLYATLQSLVNPGDEVVVFEPAFDIYASQVTMAGGITTYVPLRPPQEDAAKQVFWFDLNEFESKLNERTKCVLLNTPHNPTGKIFSMEELSAIAKVLEKYPHIIVIADEVYENIVYEGCVHTRFATLPGMWDRTITLSSAGKTFSVTGWKIGWLIGPQPLIKNVMIVNQWVQFSIATPLQKGVAQMLLQAKEEYQGHANYYAYLKHYYSAKKDILIKSLTDAGITPYLPEGGFFIVGDTSKISFPESYMKETTLAAPTMYRDWAFCRWLTKEIGVAAIPPSAFYCDENKPLANSLARFAFCKSDQAIEEAGKRLLKLNEYKGC